MDLGRTQDRHREGFGGWGYDLAVRVKEYREYMGQLHVRSMDSICGTVVSIFYSNVKARCMMIRAFA